MKTETRYTLNTDGLTITVKEKEKHNIEDLRQHLIEYLLDKKGLYNECDIELIKMLIEDEKKIR